MYKHGYRKPTEGDGSKIYAKPESNTKMENLANQRFSKPETQELMV